MLDECNMPIGVCCFRGIAIGGLFAAGLWPYFLDIAFRTDWKVLEPRDFDDLIGWPSKKRFGYDFVPRKINVRYVGPGHIMISLGHIDSVFPNGSQSVLRNDIVKSGVTVFDVIFHESTVPVLSRARRSFE
jgi:hypothetical protein